MTDDTDAVRLAQAFAANIPHPHVHVASLWPQAKFDYFDERAAIYEFEAGYSRIKAEELAMYATTKRERELRDRTRAT